MSNPVSTAYGQVDLSNLYPQQNASAVYPTRSGSAVSSVLAKFLKGEPKALGTVQIMIGVMMILFGIVNAVTINTDDFGSVISGIMVCGAIIYIIAGSLTVAADNNLNQCLVKASMVMNIFSTITAGIAVIFFPIDILITYFDCYDYGGYDDNIPMMCRKYSSKSMWNSGVLLLFSILEFILSIVVSAFACTVTCCTRPEPVVVFQNYDQQTLVPMQNPASAPSTSRSVCPDSRDDAYTALDPRSRWSEYDTLDSVWPDSCDETYTALDPRQYDTLAAIHKKGSPPTSTRDHQDSQAETSQPASHSNQPTNQPT